LGYAFIEITGDCSQNMKTIRDVMDTNTKRRNKIKTTNKYKTDHP
jgi:hypothetical protein